MAVRNHLRRVREEQMMSKAELARRAGVSVLTVDRIEKGFACRHATKRKILAALEIDIKDRRQVFPDPEPEEDDLGDGAAGQQPRRRYG